MKPQDYIYVNGVPTVTYKQYEQVTQAADSIRLSLFLQEYSHVLKTKDDWDRLLASIPFITHH